MVVGCVLVVHAQVRGRDAAERIVKILGVVIAAVADVIVAVT